MKRILITALLLLSVSATPALAGPAPKQQIAAQKATIAKLRSQLQTARSAAKAQHRKDAGRIAELEAIQRRDIVTVAREDNQIFALQEQISQRTRDRVASVLAGTQDDVFHAVQEIWTAFPKLPFGQTCGGYDKSSSLTVYADKSTASTWTFSLAPCVA